VDERFVALKHIQFVRREAVKKSTAASDVQTFASDETTLDCSVKPPSELPRLASIDRDQLILRTVDVEQFFLAWNYRWSVPRAFIGRAR
jgi:hypothetical protein